MFIWTLAILLFVVVGALGYLQGALRLVVSLLGLFLGMILAVPLSPLLARFVPMIGVKHPVWSIVWPPIWAFLLVLLIFLGVGFFVQRKVNLYFKYRADDFARLRWERMNKQLGVCLGLFMSVVWLFLVGLIIHITGYFAVQVTSDDTSSMTFRYLSRAKQDLHSTGLEKCVAVFDPMPPLYYEVSDIIGLIYNNPILLNRLSQYPPFLTLGQRQEFQDIATDAEYNNLLLSKGDITQILSHPKTQAVIYNPEIVQELLRQDLKDLRHYLETGKSPKYDDEKILGRWSLDFYSTLTQERKKKPNITASEMIRLKKDFESLKTVSFMATTDNKATRKVDVSEQLKQAAQAAAQAAAAAAAQASSAGPGLSPEMARRYNMPPPSAPSSPGAPTTRSPRNAESRQLTADRIMQDIDSQIRSRTNAELRQPIYSAEGTWQREGDKYQLKLKDEKGGNETVQANADDEKLVVHGPGKTWVFTRAE